MNSLLKVSKSQKQVMVSLILPKNETVTEIYSHIHFLGGLRTP